MKHLWIILLLFVAGCKEPVVINVYQMDVNEVAERVYEVFCEKQNTATAELIDPNYLYGEMK